MTRTIPATSQRRTRSQSRCAWRAVSVRLELPHRGTKEDNALGETTCLWFRSAPSPLGQAQFPREAALSGASQKPHEVQSLLGRTSTRDRVVQLPKIPRQEDRESRT